MTNPARTRSPLAPYPAEEKQMEESILLENDFEYAFKFRKTEKRFNRLWGMKSSARESLKDWLIASDINPKVSEVCANACSELIENCVKFSKNDSTAVVSINVSDRSITVETINKAEKEHRETVSREIEALNAASDPRQVFAEKLLNPAEGKSQLGIIKISMETKGKLELVQEPDEEIVRMKLEMKAE